MSKFEFKTGNILEEDAEALVNTVNCVGIMGRGIALQFKYAFPENYKIYAAACKMNQVQPGSMLVYETGQLTNPRYIINFPTKRHWRGKSRLEDIEAGLVALAHVIRDKNIHSIALPPLGSGLGGLVWADVRELIEKKLESLDHVKIILFEPHNQQDAAANPSTEVPKMTPGRAALVILIHRYLNGLLDPFITLLEIHKLLYFMQYAGEPLKLRFAKALYGPYAENLRHVLKAVEGHLISGYSDRGDHPDIQLRLIPGALADATNFLSDKNETNTHLEKVFDLVDGFESPFGLELLSTVHWICANEHASTISKVIESAYSWNTRKRQFSPRQIELALKVLTEKQWLKNQTTARTINTIQ